MFACISVYVCKWSRWASKYVCQCAYVRQFCACACECISACLSVVVRTQKHWNIEMLLSFYSRFCLNSFCRTAIVFPMCICKPPPTHIFLSLPPLTDPHHIPSPLPSFWYLLTLALSGSGANSIETKWRLRRLCCIKFENGKGLLVFKMNILDLTLEHRKYATTSATNYIHKYFFYSIKMFLHHH